MYTEKNIINFLVIPILLILVEGCGQSWKVRQYYKKVNKAEESIIKGKLAKASTQYSMAFNKSVYPFYRDARNAFIVEVMLDKHVELMQSYSTILMRYDIDIFNDTSEVFVKYLMSTNRYSQILKFQENFSTISTDSFYLNQKFDLIRKLDQDIRIECTKINQGNTYTGFCKDSIMKVDSLNQTMLLEILGQINIDNRKYLSRSSFRTIDLTIAHSMQWNKFPSLKIYESLIQVGLLDSRSYAYTYDHRSSEAYAKEDSLLRLCGMYGSHLGFKSGQYFFITKGNTPNYVFDLASVNRKRGEIYLEDIYSSLEKTAWSILCSGDLFTFYPYRIYANDDEFPQSFIDNIRKDSLPVEIIENTICNDIDN